MTKETVEKTITIPFEAFRPKTNPDGSKTLVMQINVEGGIRLVKDFLKTADKEDHDDLLEQYFNLRLAQICGVKALPINLEQEKTKC